jgi:hypothetical protein
LRHYRWRLCRSTFSPPHATQALNPILDGIAVTAVLGLFSALVFMVKKRR